nr:hypothetical protein [Agrococcus lahaulensis]
MSAMSTSHHAAAARMSGTPTTMSIVLTSVSESMPNAEAVRPR